MKLSKILPLFLFGVALSVCTLSCGDGGDSEDSATKTTTENPADDSEDSDEKKTPENPTVNSENTVAATSLEGVINAETLQKDEWEDSDRIKITRTDGKFSIHIYGWEVWEIQIYEDGSITYYYGDFTGDLSKIGTEDVVLKFSVSGASKNGKLYPVSEKKEFDFVATPTSFSAKIPEVELKDLSYIKEPEVTLPESVGENPFSGKTFKEYEEENGDRHYKRTYTFSDSIATEIYESYENGILTFVSETEYRYTYDASKNLLYLAYKSEIEYDYIDGKKVIGLRIDSFVDYVAFTMEDCGADEDFAYADAYSLYSVPSCMQYEINEDNIVLKEYFDGTLPTQTGFSYHNNNYKPSISIGDGAAYLDFRYDGKRFECPKPTYSDGTVSGKVYKDYKLLGEIEGTYTTSGTGTSDCTVTLTFTKLPSELTEAGFEIGKEYTLTNGSSKTSYHEYPENYEETDTPQDMQETSYSEGTYEEPDTPQEPQGN